jgi:hypothetical protein
MKYLVAVLQATPLMIHFSFHHQEAAAAVAYLPRLLRPLGYFVSVKITDSQDAVVYASDKPKIKLKLHPERAESYYALEPGYTYGCVLTIADFTAQAGNYHATVTYSNQDFRGFPDHNLGEMSHTARLTLRVD